MGTLIPPVNTFNERGWVIRDCYWIQRLWDARIRILVGRADISDYVGSHWMQNVNNSFANRSFSANPAVPFPGHGPMAGISLRPVEQFYLTAGAINGYSDTTEVGLETLFDEWDLFSTAEVGWTPVIEGLGPGRYAFMAWHMDARELWNLPEDYGFTFIADQNLGDGWQVFARYAWNDGPLTGIRNLGQAGVGRDGFFGREDDLTGFALSLADPAAHNVRYETVLEIFHRFQLTRHTQFSVGLQLIANPVNAPDNETAGVFYARVRTSF
jgi:carbohydrate-selective porin OprB